MKKMLACILCLLMFVTPFASANPFVNSSKPAGMWSVNDGRNFVGEEIFDAMLAEVKQQILLNVEGAKDTKFEYSPYLYAIIESLIAEGADPHETMFRLGDSSSDMMPYFTALKELGYINDIPTTFTEDVAAAVRKIQYAAGLPVTGELTRALAKGLLSSFAIPDNTTTLSELSDAASAIRDKCNGEFQMAQEANEIISKVSAKDIDNNFGEFVNAITAAMYSYVQSHTYLPSYVVTYQLYTPITSDMMTMFDGKDDTEAVNIVANSSALLSILFYCAEYDLNHDYAGYAAEYYDLLRK